MKRFCNVIIMAILVFLCIGMGVIHADAQNTTLSESPSGNPISIYLIYPEEGDVVYHDVSPAYLTVEGSVYAIHGIRNVSITNGEESVECDTDYGVYYNLSCNIRLYSTTNQVTVIVNDTLGNTLSEIRHINSYTGPPPPGATDIYGMILDTDGHPISNATITIESSDINGPFSVITKSRSDGSYHKWTHGSPQKITVQKNGYSSASQTIYTPFPSNKMDFTLVPSNKSVPGFDAVLCLSGISLSWIGVFLRKKSRSWRKL